ncbi:MAG: glycerophosphodiester phosphodiesterase [Candidatus Saccharimonadales bacterium]
MLIIGHRGAADLAPENSLDALRKGADVGADALEFDVQITRDGVPIVIHDSTLLRTHRKRKLVRWSSHESIRQATAKGHQIATLEEVLDEFFGLILLNLEVKSYGTGKIVYALIKEKYIKKDDDWQNILISSFKPRELVRLRKLSPLIELAMLHNRNPFGYMAYHRRLNFTAIGFHRLYTNSLATAVAKQLGIFTYVYTVDRPQSARRLAGQGIDGIVTNDPGLMRSELNDIL